MDTANDLQNHLVYSTLETWKSLKPCLELLEGTLNEGISVINQLVMESSSNNGLANILFKWLSKPINWIPLE